MAECVVDLPLHIIKLESPEGFGAWVLEMEQYLIATNLWEWTNVENKDAPTAEIQALAIDSSNRGVRTTAPAALEEKISTWKRGYELARNAIMSRLGHYYTLDFKYETYAYELWNRIMGYFKPADLTALNNLYRRLDSNS